MLVLGIQQSDSVIHMHTWVCVCVLVAQSCPTLCNPMDCILQAPLSMRILQARILEWAVIPFSRGSYQPWSLLKFMSIESVMLSNRLILCYPLLLLPSIFPSIRVFPKESALCIRQPKYWSFSISPPNEYSRLISFRIDWFDLAVHWTLKGLLQHHSSTASTFWCCISYLPCVTRSHKFSGLKEHLCIISQLCKSEVGVGSSGFLS